MSFASKLISYLFHPIIMPAIAFVLVMDLGIEFVPFVTLDLKRKILFYLIIPFTIYFPLSFLVMLRLSKNVSSFRVHTRKERIPLYIGTFIFYLAAYIFARSLTFSLPILVYSMMLGGVISLFLTTVITLKWKISAHAIGISGVLGTLFATGEHIATYFYFIGDNPVFWPIINVTLLTGAISSSRLSLNAHTPSQIYAGLMVGFLSLYLPIKFLIVI